MLIAACLLSLLNKCFLVILSYPSHVLEKAPNLQQKTRHILMMNSIKYLLGKFIPKIVFYQNLICYEVFYHDYLFINFLLLNLNNIYIFI